MPDQEFQSSSRKWQRPRPLGYGAAVQAMAGTAAPLLAGFSIALVGVVAQAPEAIRWPGASLLALIMSSALLVSCVQFGFRAREYLYSKAELDEWEPTSASEFETDYLRKKQREHFGRWEFWSNLANWCYDLGIVALSVAVAVTVAPPDQYGVDPVTDTEENIRWAGFALALASGAAEAIWISVAERRKRKEPRQRPDRSEVRGQTS